MFVEGLQANTTLTELDFSRNDIMDKLGMAKGLAESLRLVYRSALLQGLQISKCLLKVCRPTAL